MTDLAILVPSRGRPGNVARLAETCAKTCRTGYVLHFGFDADDLDLTANVEAAKGSRQMTRMRMGLTAWTNHLAAQYATRRPAYFASLGDDMVPITDGWDEQLITAVEHTGGGFAYPDDKRRTDIPEACVMSSSIVTALGWMALPSLDHWYIDNVWADLGNGAGCLTYCPTVVVEHRHPNVHPQTKSDATYHDAAHKFNADAAVYRRWRLYQMPADILTVKTCLSPRP